MEAPPQIHNSFNLFVNPFITSFQMNICNTNVFETSSSSVIIRNEIGVGHTSRVFEGRTQEGEIVAIKCINPGPAAFHYYSSELKALDNLSGLSYIVQLRNHQVHALPVNFHSKNHQIILEYCPNGDLFGLVEKFGRGLPEPLARAYARQIITSVHSFHSRGIAHMDIKPENIMLAKDWTIRMCDFGFATAANTSSCLKRGTEFFSAPEVLSGGEYLPSTADIWSTGVSLFVLLFGVPPFHRADKTCWYFKAVRQKKWDLFWGAHEKNRPDNVLNETAKLFLQFALEPNPEFRPSALQMLQSEWLMSDEPELCLAEAITELGI